MSLWIYNTQAKKEEPFGPSFTRIHPTARALHGHLRDHPDRLAVALAVALDVVVHLCGDEVVVGGVRVRFDGLDALQEVLEVAEEGRMHASLLGDFKHLLESVKAIKADADASNNYLVSAKMDDYIESYSKSYSKAIWMISQVSM